VPRPASPARSLGDTEVRLGGTIGVSFPRREWREMTASFRPNVGPRLHHRGYCWTRAADCLENLKPGGRWSKAGQELARRGRGGGGIIQRVGRDDLLVVYILVVLPVVMRCPVSLLCFD